MLISAMNGINSNTEQSNDSDTPLVSVCCITYNHEKYIRDAVEGFLMQKTDFPIEILIHDDASTDGTAEIVREFETAHPDLIQGIYQKDNLFSKGLHLVLRNVYTATRGKYIALCEGDDYWTNPLKLQKQVDFLESHPECSICCHKVKVRYQGYEEKNHLFPDIDGDKVFSRDEMHGKYISATCSVVFRRLKIDQLVQYLEGFSVGDIPLYFFYLELGSFGYIDQVMATYRKNAESYWNPHYDDRFPVLFDTIVKVKSRLKIHGSKGLNTQISYCADEVLKELYKKRDFKGMRQVIRKDIFSISAAKKHRQRRFVIYALIAYFPALYYLYKSFSHENDVFKDDQC